MKLVKLNARICRSAVISVLWQMERMERYGYEVKIDFTAAAKF